MSFHSPLPLALPQGLLPPLPRAGAGSDLTPVQQRVMVGGIVLAHLVAGWGLLQVNAVRDAVIQAAPMFVDILPPPAPPAPRAPPPPPQPQPLLKKPPPPDPVIAAVPSPAPAAFTAPAPVPEPALPAPAPPAPVVAAAMPAPPAPPPTPRVIPASAVQFLEPPAVEYPRQSKRNAEAGTVVVRAWVDTGGGAPRSLQVERSSGFVRLDQAALSAVQKARFKPYTENGRPVEGWALIPINFELEK